MVQINVGPLPNFTEEQPTSLYLLNDTFSFTDEDSANRFMPICKLKLLHVYLSISVVYIQSFTATLIGGSNNESLSFANSSTLNSSMVCEYCIVLVVYSPVSYVSIQGRQATLSGNATLDDYMEAVSSLVYINTGDELICPLLRDVNLTIQDKVYVETKTIIIL